MLVARGRRSPPLYRIYEQHQESIPSSTIYSLPPTLGGGKPGTPTRSQQQPPRLRFLRQPLPSPLGHFLVALLARRRRRQQYLPRFLLLVLLLVLLLLLLLLLPLPAEVLLVLFVMVVVPKGCLRPCADQAADGVPAVVGPLTPLLLLLLLRHRRCRMPGAARRHRTPAQACGTCEQRQVVKERQERWCTLHATHLLRCA